MCRWKQSPLQAHVSLEETQPTANLYTVRMEITSVAPDLGGVRVGPGLAANIDDFLPVTFGTNADHVEYA